MEMYQKYFQNQVIDIVLYLLTQSSKKAVCISDGLSLFIPKSAFIHGDTDDYLKWKRRGKAARLAARVPYRGAWSGWTGASSAALAA